MKTKSEKRNEARKNAEAVKASRKAARMSKGSLAPQPGRSKGKSLVPQVKKKK